jgi:hypothetical protein
MTIISGSVVLALTEVFSANSPIIGSDNVLALGNTAADSEQDDYPVSNLCNPATNLLWKSDSTATQYVTISHGDMRPIDYLAIHGHNLGSTGCVVSIEGDEDGQWVELVPEIRLADDAPKIFRFDKAERVALRFKIQPTSVKPEIAVMQAGELLVLPRPVYVGHTPLNFGLASQVTNGKSESGHFLGRIVLRRSYSTVLALEHIPKKFYRERMAAFVERSCEYPFFLAWRPGEYGHEVGYAWSTNDARPVNSQPEGFMSIELSVGGLIR